MNNHVPPDSRLDFSLSPIFSDERNIIRLLDGINSHGYTWRLVSDLHFNLHANVVSDFHCWTQFAFLVQSMSNLPPHIATRVSFLLNKYGPPSYGLYTNYNQVFFPPVLSSFPVAPTFFPPLEHRISPQFLQQHQPLSQHISSSHTRYRKRHNYIQEHSDCRPPQNLPLASPVRDIINRHDTSEHFSHLAAQTAPSLAHEAAALAAAENLNCIFVKPDLLADTPVVKVDTHTAAVDAVAVDAVVVDTLAVAVDTNVVDTYAVAVDAVAVDATVVDTHAATVDATVVDTHAATVDATVVDTHAATVDAVAADTHAATVDAV